MDLSGKRVIVVGLGVSGVAAAALCVRRGARVVGTDAKPFDALAPEARSLASKGVELLVGGHQALTLSDADLVVVSPGVPAFPALEEAARSTEVIGEVELAVRALAHPAALVAVGGTNGKSTVTSLVGAFFEANGQTTFTGGNLGEPLAAHADERFDVVVLEVSSFQMERVRAFRPRASILLNVTDDHLDRYASFGDYAAAKGNAFVRQTGDDAAVVPRGDAVCERQARRGKGRLVTFGPGGVVDVTEDAVVDTRTGTRFPTGEMLLQGAHNASNAAAAIAAAGDMGISGAVMRRVLGVFRGLPHRMAFVAEIDGVRYYDDSKGTNVGASVTALRGLREKRAVLIAGGRDKLGSYGPLVDALRERGRALVLIGEATAAIERAAKGAIEIHHGSSMDDAVARARKAAQPGDAVLLSPACSSFDMFRDYKHRGDEFVRVVRAMKGAGLGDAPQGARVASPGENR
jgi:UDP-N-acetylmuramoylalanine--D-glutamate ligase